MSTQDKQERNYHRAMANLTKARGYLNLAQAHALAAKDCPRGCGCSGCESTQRDARAAREAKERRATRKLHAVNGGVA